MIGEILPSFIKWLAISIIYILIWWWSTSLHGRCLVFSYFGNGYSKDFHPFKKKAWWLLGFQVSMRFFPRKKSFRTKIPCSSCFVVVWPLEIKTFEIKRLLGFLTFVFFLFGKMGEMVLFQFFAGEGMHKDLLSSPSMHWRHRERFTVNCTTWDVTNPVNNGIN